MQKCDNKTENYKQNHRANKQNRYIKMIADKKQYDRIRIKQ